MSRTTVVALAVAAVVGTTGGIALAVTTVGTQEDKRPAASGSTPATPTGEESSGESKDPADALFYYADGAIHDGSQNVPVPTGIADSDVLELARVDGGWLVVENGTDSSGDPLFTGTFVPEKGSAWRIGEWRGSFDLTAERDRVLYGNGVNWKAAEFATRKATPLDVVDGPGEELEFMTRPDIEPGIAITARGVLTGWRSNGETLIVQTETDQWSHELLVLPRTVQVPLTSADGRFAIATYDDTEPSSEVPGAGCLTGGRMDAVDLWWTHCETGPASAAPYSPDGEQVLVGRTVTDGPAPSGLEVIDATTGNLVHEFDPGNYLIGAEWAEQADTVFTLTAEDNSNTQSISRCDVTTGACAKVAEVEGNVVLGSVS
ncbi:hypothetical protein ASE01_03785 [Nocardioides sp. Root190]|uniref:hypothetical protein n=1 Tax=Nocardioides sp. Root190 TaxID=1736488 RepID=UPI0006F325C1|nr:hypothetical protein [Nocardioides sp. Root190]KRB78404.1 hypothetical protein ASE01_03785 [Nocardioides sp. Root190]